MWLVWLQPPPEALVPLGSLGPLVSPGSLGSLWSLGSLLSPESLVSLASLGSLVFPESLVSLGSLGSLVSPGSHRSLWSHVLLVATIAALTPDVTVENLIGGSGSCRFHVTSSTVLFIIA
jgi:hypothetical protein